jgi:hypothetical protein
VIALDTNILVYAHRADARWHEAARTQVKQLAEARAAWAIPWPCLHEFLAIVSHPRIYDPPTPTEAALDQVDAWSESPSLVVLSETHEHWAALRELLRKAAVTGPRVHDARVAALCVAHGVRELWTADRDFGRWSELKTRNPLVEA